MTRFNQILKVRLRFLCGGGLFVFLLLVGSAVLLPDPSVGAPKPPRDFRLRVIALGNWKGEFGLDAAGSGGLATLKTYTEMIRRQMVHENGDVLLLYSGNFSSAGNAEQFERRVRIQKTSLPLYLGFDAIALTSDEQNYYRTLVTRGNIRSLEVIGFDSQAPTNKEQGNRSPVAPFRRLQKGNVRIFITAVTGGKTRQDFQNTLRQLNKTLYSNENHELFVFLTSVATGGDRKNLAPLFDTDPEGNPFKTLSLKNPALRSIVIETGSRTNGFFRMVYGNYVCRIHERTLCEIEFRFRKRRIIAVNQRFVNLNHPSRPGARIPADPFLSELLKKR